MTNDVYKKVAERFDAWSRARMDMGRYNRRVTGHFSGICLLIVTAAFVMWIAALGDVILNLGWGWDRQIIWIAPIICLGALAIRFVGRLIFRAIGAARR